MELPVATAGAAEPGRAGPFPDAGINTRGSAAISACAEEVKKQGEKAIAFVCYLEEFGVGCTWRLPSKEYSSEMGKNRATLRWRSVTNVTKVAATVKRQMRGTSLRSDVCRGHFTSVVPPAKPRTHLTMRKTQVRDSLQNTDPPQTAKGIPNEGAV